MLKLMPELIPEKMTSRGWLERRRRDEMVSERMSLIWFMEGARASSVEFWSFMNSVMTNVSHRSR